MQDHPKHFLLEPGTETERNTVVQEKENTRLILLFLQAKLFKATQKSVKKENHTISLS